MILNGKRLALRKSIDDDLEFLCSIASDKEIWTFSQDIELDTDKLKRILMDRIHGEDSYNFIMHLSDDRQTPIGIVDMWIYHKKNRIWEISYAILPNYRNKGFCAETLDLLMNFAFNELNVHKIAIVTEP